MLYATLIAPIP